MKKCLRKYQLENTLKEKLDIGVLLKFMSNLMDEKNMAVVIDRDKLQNGKR